MGKIVNHAHYDDVPEMLKALDGKAEWGTSSSETGYYRERPWALGASWKDSTRMAVEGWDGAAKVLNMASQVVDKVVTNIPRQVPELAVSGHFPDVGEFMAGAPECMIDLSEINDQSRQVKIVVNLCASGSVSASAMEARGLIALSCVDALETMGIRCEVIAANCISAGGSGDLSLTTLTVKRPQDAFNREQLAFFLVHPAAFRRLFFRALEIMPGDLPAKFDCQNVGDGYGHVQELPKDFQGDIYTPSMRHSYTPTPEEVVVTVKAHLVKLGVVME